MGGSIVYHPDIAPHVQIINGFATVHRAAVVSAALIHIGVPISGATAPGNGFVRATLDRAVVKIEAEQLEIKAALASVSAQALHAIVLYCLRSQTDYLA